MLPTLPAAPASESAPALRLRTRAVPWLALVLAACASAPPSTDTAPLPPETGASAARPPASAPPAPPPTVAAEQRRLAGLFRDTPVIVEAPAAGQMRVVVPPPFAFDPGRAIVKPPLAKVLDHLAAGLRKQTRVTVKLSASPDGRSGNTQLARERAGSVRDYLLSRGVAQARLGPPLAGEVETVEVIVTETR